MQQGCSRRAAAARLAAATRWRGEDDPALPALRRDLRAAEAEAVLRTLAGEVATAQVPRLTGVQRTRLRGLLRVL